MKNSSSDFTYDGSLSVTGTSQNRPDADPTFEVSKDDDHGGYSGAVTTWWSSAGSPCSALTPSSLSSDEEEHSDLEDIICGVDDIVVNEDFLRGLKENENDACDGATNNYDYECKSYWHPTLSPILEEGSNWSSEIFSSSSHTSTLLECNKEESPKLNIISDEPPASVDHEQLFSETGLPDRSLQSPKDKSPPMRSLWRAVLQFFCITPASGTGTVSDAVGPPSGEKSRTYDKISSQDQILHRTRRSGCRRKIWMPWFPHRRVSEVKRKNDMPEGEKRRSIWTAFRNKKEHKKVFLREL